MNIYLPVATLLRSLKQFIYSCVIVASLFSIPAASYAQKQGKARIDSLLTELPKSKEDSGRVTLLNRVAFLFASINPDEGIRYAQQALSLARELQWEQGIGDAYNQAGICYAYKSDYPKSIDSWINALKSFEKTGSKRGALQIIGNIGNIYSIQGDYSSALENDLKALKLSEELGDKNSIALNLGNIGSVYEYLYDYDKATMYDLKALQMARDLNDKAKISMSLCNLGNLYLDRQKYDSALIFDLEALKMAQELGDVEGTGRNMLNAGQVYAQQHKYAKALDNGFSAIKLFENIGYKIGIGKATKLIANTYLALAKDSIWYTAGTFSYSSEVTGDLQLNNRHAVLMNSIAYQEKSIAIDKEVQELDDLQLSYKFLAEAQELSGDFSGALQSYRKYTEIKDSVFSAASKVRITNLETKRALELKDKQIELDRLEVLKKRNERSFFIAGMILLLVVIVIVFRYYRAQKRSNVLLSAEKRKVDERTVELNTANTELQQTLVDLKETQEQLILVEKQKENEIIRSRISQDIHDDISSELTKISWISALAQAKAKKEDYPEVNSLLDKINGYSQETVGKLGEIIWTVNPKNDTLASLFAYMRTHIAKFLEDTSLQYVVDFPDQDADIIINPELKRNLFLVMKEALNNAVKYAGAAKISVSCHIDDSGYHFVISDNGRGIEENKVQGGGNGLRNMKTRMEAINGTCRIESAPVAGTTVYLDGRIY